MKKNIFINYLYTVLSNLSFSQAIWMLYLSYRGLSLVEIGLVESIFHMTSLLMELPTGIIADKYGRKLSRIGSRVLSLIATLVLLASHSFIGMTIGFIISALAYNLESGAGDALLYDSLVASDQTHHYQKIKGIVEILYQLTSVISLLIGGYVATYSYELAYLITAGINGVAIVVSLTFKEPQFQKLPPHTGMVTYIRDSINVIRRQRVLMAYIFYLQAIGLFTTTSYFYLQPLLKSLGVSTFTIGACLAACSVVTAIGAGVANKLNARVGQRNLIIGCAVIAMICLFAFTLHSWGIVAFVVLTAVEGILFVNISGYMNAIIPSSYRATLLSFSSMVFSVLMMIYFPLFGYLSEHHSYQMAFVSMFCMALPVMALTTFQIVKSR